MAIEDALKLAVDRIRSGQLQKEEQVKHSVILPLLRALSWDDADPSQVIPEYPVNNGSVDYALCRPTRTPFVFLEAKRLESMDESGVAQVFGYAANRGVPFLVLTDGNIWDFYLSMADGVPADRRFYRIELERLEKIAEYAVFFEEYLRKDRVSMHETRLAAEQLRDGDRQKEKARNAIPGVWRALLAAGDQSLCSLLVDAVEGECGTQPELDDAEAFLKNMAATTIPAGQRTVNPAISTSQGAGDRRSKIVGFVLDEQTQNVGNGIRTLVEVIREFDRRSPVFMEQFAERTRGRTRRLVSRDRDHLYDQVSLRKQAMDLGNGWWLGTNLSTESIRKNIGTACSVMDLRLGSQLKIIES